jgi:hypothetical protein
MSDETHSKTAEAGFAGLPKGWAGPVQIVSTFGLAVFLVLYYVLVMQPKEAARYEQLRQSVDTLSEIVGAQQSLLTREQAVQLEELFIMAMGNEAAALIVTELKANPIPDRLAAKIEDKLIFETRLLQGLKRKDGGTISEMMTHKIRNSEISQQIAQRAVDQWKEAEFQAIANECRAALNFALQRAAMAK